MKTTYHGSCHGKAVTFEAGIDLEKGTCSAISRCAGSSGCGTLANSRPATGVRARPLCTCCRTVTHGHGAILQMGGEPYNLVHLAALDDLPLEDLVAAPLTFMDGLHDNWWNPPTETR